jgi:hypothetical protein
MRDRNGITWDHVPPVGEEASIAPLTSMDSSEVRNGHQQPLQQSWFCYAYSSDYCGLAFSCRA